MRRSTYYAYFLEMSINVNAEGDVVGKLPNLTSPDILGIPVVFSITAWQQIKFFMESLTNTHLLNVKTFLLTTVNMCDLLKIKWHSEEKAI